MKYKVTVEKIEEVLKNNPDSGIEVSEEDNKLYLRNKDWINIRMVTIILFNLKIKEFNTNKRTSFE